MRPPAGGDRRGPRAGAATAAALAALLAAAAAAAAAAGAARAAEPPPGPPRVAEIALELPAGDDPAAAGALVALAPGDALVARGLRRTVQRLFQTGRYRNVVVRAAPVPAPAGEDGRWVRLVVEALPVRSLDDVVVELDGPGTDEGSVRVAAGVAPGGPIDDADLPSVEARVRAALARRGYRGAAVAASMRGDLAVVLELRVRPGDPIRVAAVRLGGDVGSGADALSALQTRPGEILDEEVLAVDVRRLRVALHSAGHRRARVGTPAVRVADGRAVVEIPVEAGPRLAFAFRGNEEVASAALLGELGFEEGQPVDVPAVGAAVERLVAFYRARGHAAARVEAEEVRRGRDLVVVFHVEEGRRYRLERVGVEGGVHRSEAWLRERLEGLLDEDAPEPDESAEDDARVLALSVPGARPARASRARSSRTRPGTRRRGTVRRSGSWTATAPTVPRGGLPRQHGRARRGAGHGARRAALPRGAADHRGVDLVRGERKGLARGARARDAARAGRSARVRARRGDADGDRARLPLARPPVRAGRGARGPRSRAPRRGPPLRRVGGAAGPDRPHRRDRQPPHARLGGAQGALRRGGGALRSRGVRREPGGAPPARRLPLGVAAGAGPRGAAGDEGRRGRARGAPARHAHAGPRLLHRERPTRVPGVGAAEPARPRARALRACEGELPARRVPPRPRGRGAGGPGGGARGRRAAVAGARRRAPHQRPHRRDRRGPPSQGVRPAARDGRGGRGRRGDHADRRLPPVRGRGGPDRQDRGRVGLPHPGGHRGAPLRGHHAARPPPVGHARLPRQRRAPAPRLVRHGAVEYARSLDEGGPLGLLPSAQSHTNMLKLSSTASGYLPVGSGTVVALSVRGGRVIPLDDRSTTVIPRRFFLGGANTMRGFAEEEMIPQDLRSVLAAEARHCATTLSGVGCTERGAAIAAGDRPVSEGGETFLLGKAEVRMRLRGSLEGGVFADIGNLWLNPRAFRLLDLRANVGFGLRFVTPIGPAVLDVGFNLDPDETINERTAAFHFTVGLF